MRSTTPTRGPRSRPATHSRTARTALFAAVLLPLAACGGQASVVLTLGSGVVQLVRGGDATVEVSLARVGGAGGDVVLAVTGEPEDVAWSFSPPVLAGDTLTSTLTLSAEAAASEGAYDLSVVATGPGLAAGAALQLEVVSLTVKGRIASLPGASPAGIQVGSQGVTAVSDEDGGFELSGLSVPYDVAVWDVADPNGGPLTWTWYDVNTDYRV